MKRFSSSYCYRLSNFAVIGCDEPDDRESPWYPLFCVVQNILQRGMPTAPSKRLEAMLGPAIQSDANRPLLRYITHDHHWKQTIKGAPSGYNPAREFYEELLPEALPDQYRYILNYLLPEAYITDIVEDCDPRFTDQQVDFYCDRAQLVIEIDGSQHEAQTQAYLDRERDLYLKIHGIDTLRIPTATLDAEQAAALLVSRFRDDHEPPESPEVAENTHAYEVAMRTQLALLALLKTNRLSLEAEQWRLTYRCDLPFIDAEALFEATARDLFDLFEALCELLDRPFTAPELILTPDAPITVDVSATKLWSDIELHSAAICVRSDYYELTDHYQVACAEPLTYQTMAECRREPVDRALHFFLEHLFGYTDFNPGQTGIIRRALALHPTLGILPTGSGKSLCYQMACLLQPSISFIVCPIISLIQDQEDNTRVFGIDHVGRIESQMKAEEKNEVLTALGNARLQFVWISPERFQMRSFRTQLEEISEHHNFAYAVIDEVHCLSEWGHDFRVSYLKLYDTICTYCPSATVIALTATASRNVLEDLLAELHITKANVQTSPNLDRPELHYHIIKTDSDAIEKDFNQVIGGLDQEFSERESISTIFEPQGDQSICGIVFANTKNPNSYKNNLKSCEGIKAYLQAQSIKTDSYHADKGDERTLIQKRFMDNEFTVMAATKAFGMGVNKKNVRYTIHCGLPWSIEAFYQEAGRAGRDRTNNYSECYILYDPDPDTEKTDQLFAPATTIKEIKELQPKLQGDLNTLFFLWCGNREDIATETEAIVQVFVYLNRHQDVHHCVLIDRKFIRGINVDTQDAIYKLAILGVVKDWTVDYRAGVYEVVLADEITEDLVKASLERYIKRHTPHFSFERPSPAHQKYVDILTNAEAGKKFVAFIKVLLQWTNDNIIFNRRRAIGNIFNLCEADYDEETLRTYINNYFRLDTESSDQLDEIVTNQTDLETWYKLFTTYELTDDPMVQNELMKPADEIDAISALCDRYRESYNENIGLEWASMVSHLLSSNFNENEVRDQYGFIVKNVPLYESLDFDRLFEQTVNFLADAPEEARDAFGAAVVTATPDRALATHARLEDLSTLSYLISESANALTQTWGRIEDHGQQS